jgi:hypothetical protein
MAGERTLSANYGRSLVISRGHSNDRSAEQADFRF